MKYDRIYNAIPEKANAEDMHCKYLLQIIYSENSTSAYYVPLTNWINDLKTTLDNWYDIYPMSLCINKDTKLKHFQFKLLHIILPCNSYIYKSGLNQLFMETEKNMLHLFWNCNSVQHFSLYVKNTF